MGPPKKKPKKPAFNEVQQKQNTFEYRWNIESQSYFLFNPWTGETIFDASLQVLDRSKSMWSKPEAFPSKNAEKMDLYPEFYSSRRWGRRVFVPYATEQDAAKHIGCVARGFLARLRLRALFRWRFCIVMCKHSHYYYFVDQLFPEKESSWYKPRLAVPGDIKEAIVDDPEEYLKGKKYSKFDFGVGPFIKVKGVQKSVTERAAPAVKAFKVDNPWREIAIARYENIEFYTSSIGDIISWMEGTKSLSLELSEVHMMRAAAAISGWSRIVHLMTEHPNNFVIQIYGFHSMSKTFVPLDFTGVLDNDAATAMYLCMDIITDADHRHDVVLKVFALAALHNILSVRPGRVEFLSTASVPEQGDLRQPAVAAFYDKRLGIFNRYLTKIPNETVKLFLKGSKKTEDIVRPLPRSVEMVYGCLQCLADIAQEIETKEQLAYLVVRCVFFAVDICQEEPLVVYHALQVFYNLCYRCESGQEAVITGCPQGMNQFFDRVYLHHSGDSELMYQARRLELALKDNGWRGNVETLLTREMKGEELEEEYLRPATFGKKEFDDAGSKNSRK